ncbi:MAG: hypothetical protein ACTHLY_04805 [Pseudolabrys sp.]
MTRDVDFTGAPTKLSMVATGVVAVDPLKVMTQTQAGTNRCRISFIDPEAGRLAPGIDVMWTGETPRWLRLWLANVQVVGKCCGDSTTFTGSIAASLPQFLRVPAGILNASATAETKHKP